MISFFNIWEKNAAEFQKFSGKSKLRQLLEIIYYRFHGFSPVSYYAIPLFLESGKRPLISEQKYHELERYLNPRHTGVVPFNKWIQSCFWKGNGLPHAVTLGFIKKQSGVLNGKVLKGTEKELCSFFSKSELPLVIKPINGANGIGFDIIDKYNRADMTVTLRKKGEMTLKAFKSLLFSDNVGANGYVVQEYIVQHPEVANFFSHSVNSLRVVTHMDQNGDFYVDCALMKFGAGNSITDNNNVEGRVFAFMDIASGFLEKGFISALSHRPVALHPDTKYPIERYRVPFWKECLELALNAHSYLPFPRHLGWDIAISHDGPLIIELNSFLAIPIYQKGDNNLMTSTAFGRSYHEIH